MLTSKPGSLESNGLNGPTPNGPGAEVTNLLDVCLAQVAALGESGRRLDAGLAEAADMRRRADRAEAEIDEMSSLLVDALNELAEERRAHAETMRRFETVRRSRIWPALVRRLQGDAWCPCAEAKGCATAPGPAPKRRCLNPGGASIRSDLGLLPESRRGGAGRRCGVARRALRFGPWSAPWS